MLSSRTRGDTTDVHGPLQRLLERTTEHLAMPISLPRPEPLPVPGRFELCQCAHRESLTHVQCDEFSESSIRKTLRAQSDNQAATDSPDACDAGDRLKPGEERSLILLRPVNAGTAVRD
jgi:hypothetical protein